MSKDNEKCGGSGYYTSKCPSCGADYKRWVAGSWDVEPKPCKKCFLVEPDKEIERLVSGFKYKKD